MKCDLCDNQATVHLIEIQGDKRVERHLCEAHAVQEGVAVKVQNAPIDELLEKFVLQHSGIEVAQQQPRQSCSSCNLTYEEFRKSGLLGCPECYTAFEAPLVPLLERAHEGASRHLGKVPAHAGINELRQQRLRQLRRDLEQAVACEQYERAADLRDQLSKVEEDKA
jgi:protein arginine kinase activator